MKLSDRIIDFGFMKLACFPMHITEGQPKSVRVAATFLWFPWWLFLTAPLWAPICLVGLIVGIWELA